MIAALLLALGCAIAAPAVQDAIPSASPAAPAAERLVDVLVHGNHTTPDADVIAIAGLTIGGPLAPDAMAAATKRLESADRFEAVEIRKRYRSIEHADEVVLVILIDERPHPMEVPGPPVTKPFRTLRDGLMFLPLVSYTDGYGLSYGAQFSFADVLGKRSRIGVPLTWGAERRVAVELERKFQHGPVSRLEGGTGIIRREHPFYDVPDRRGEVWARAERALPLALRVGGGVRWSDIAFGGESTPAFDLDDRLLASGVDLTLDTRADPTFPRNAVYARAAWEHLDFEAQPARNRTTLEGRGFVGLFGSSVLALRATHGRADGALPPYEQWLLGGSSLRGLSAGALVGDQRLIWSAELRMPFSSPLNVVGRTGFNLFFDGGKVAAHGESIGRAPLFRGVGGGFFINAAILNLNFEVAHSLDGRGTKFHFGTGFTF